MPDFRNSFYHHPMALAPEREHAPAFAVYHDKDISLSVDNDRVTVTIGLDTVQVDYIGKSAEEVANEISTSSSAVFCNLLNSINLLKSGELYYDGEQTPDGGKVIRARVHIVRYTESTRIRSLLPYPETRTRPWYPLVDRGSIFVWKNGVRYTFSVPEYQQQEWSTLFGAPFVDVTSERTEVVGERVLRLARAPVFFFRRNMTIRVNGIPTGSSLVRDVDEHNGLVYLSSPIVRSDRVVVDYTYREDRFLYKGVNLNPAMNQNPTIVDQVVLLYLVPSHSSIGQNRDTNTVRHIVGRTIVGAISAIPTATEPALVIGAFQVRPLAVLSDVEIKDTRLAGGGVMKDRHDQAIEANEELRSITDVGRYDGTPFPGAMAGVLRLPRGLLDTYKKDLMEERVRTHMAAGGNVIIDFDTNLSE